MEQIGVRELRQNASKYLVRVAAGETFEVTDRGRPVARLVPVEPDPWDDLVLRGLVTPAVSPGSLLSIVPAEPIPGQPTVSEALEELRRDERY